MPFREDLYQLRSDNSQTNTFEEFPIFIGMASKSVEIITFDGVTTIQIPLAENGFVYKNNSCEASIRYWNNIGIYDFSSINNNRDVINVSQTQQNEVPDLKKYQYTCFIVDSNNNIVFSAGITDLEFSYQAFLEMHVSKIFLDQNIPTSINFTSSIYTMRIVKIDDVKISSNNISELTSEVLIDISSINLINANNLQNIIEIKTYFYYTPVDFRYFTLSYDDEIPEELISNKNNELGQILVNHRAISKSKITLFTIPSKNLQNLQTAIEVISNLGNALGYFIVPLFDNSIEYALYLSEVSKDLEKSNIWINNFLQLNRIDQSLIASFSVQLTLPD